MSLSAGLALSLACSCSPASAPAAEEADDAAEAPADTATLTDVQISTMGITFGHVEQRQLSNVLRVNGQLRLNPQDRAEVASLIGGIVQRIVVTEGQHVTAGQTVAWLENTQLVELQKEALIASKEAVLAQAEMQRQDNLRSQGAGVEKTRQQAQVEYEVANARLQGLRQQLRQLGLNAADVEQGHISTSAPIRSPIGGVVSRIKVSTGSYVDMQTPLMDVADTRAVFCDLSVYDKDIELVQLGQTVDVRHSNLAASDLQGTVTQINTSIDPETKAFSVHVRLDHSDTHTLVPGMYVNAIIHTGRQLCDAVPTEAIVSAEGRQYIFVRAEGNDFVRTEVVCGSEELGYTQVQFTGQPVAPDADIVVAGAYYLGSMLGDHGEED